MFFFVEMGLEREVCVMHCLCAPQTLRGGRVWWSSVIKSDRSLSRVICEMCALWLYNID
jgi:hypothetical protein